MKTIHYVIPVLGLLTLATLPATAQEIFAGTGDANGGLGDGAGISSVVVNNDANNISFTINSTQPMDAYINYMIDIQGSPTLGAPPRASAPVKTP